MSIKLRKRKLRSGRVQLYLAIYKSGHRTYEALNMFLTKSGSQNKEVLRLADAIRAKRELDAHADAEGIASPWKRDVYLFDYALSVYENKTPLTKRCYIDAFNHLKDFAGERLTFASISERLCADYRTFLLGRLGHNSAGAYFARFKSILRMATKEGYLQRNPAGELTIHSVETHPKYLTYKQIIQLTNTPCGNATVRDAFLFSINTGLRHKDIRDLVWSQIKDGSLTFTQSKTGSPEILPLSDCANSILKRQPRRLDMGEEGGNHIFPLRRQSSVDKVLKTWAKRAGIGVVLSFHWARHSFATLMISQNVDIYTVSKLLGHKNVATTQIYAKVVDSKKKEAISKLPSIGA